jgi:hypothetical protein
MVKTKPAPPTVALLGESELTDGVDGQEQEMIGSRKIANAPRRSDLFVVVIVAIGAPIDIIAATEQASPPQLRRPSCLWTRLTSPIP